MPKPAGRAVLLTLILLGLVWTASVALTGGFQLRLAGTLIRSRDWFRPLAATAVLLIAYGIWFREHLARETDAVVVVARRGAPVVVALSAIASAAAAVQWGTFAASGADSYGYVSQAYLWSEGRLSLEQPLAARLPWPNPEGTLAPLGYHAAQRGHAIVPTYAPGLPILMALALRIAGACGPFVVVPLCTALLVWSTYLVGRRLGAPGAGAIAAVLTAASPIVLFQSMWPMSDVPVAAFWMLSIALVLGRSRSSGVGAGLTAALALLVRPNLLLIPVAIGLWLAWRTWRDRRAWLGRLVAFALPLATCAVIVSALNAYWYGAPWKTGYGGFDYLYHASNVWMNLRNFGTAFWQAHTPFVFLSLAALVGLSPRLESDAVSGRALAGWVIAAVWLSYLFYIPFSDWWYARFLLPALPLMLLLAVMAAERIANWFPEPWPPFALGAVGLAVLGSQLSFARTTAIFGRLRELEHRYVDVARYVDSALPANAAILSMQHSGTLRFYAGRLTVRYDWLDPPWLARAPRDLLAMGYHPYAVIEDWEVPDVRRRLELPPDAPLPWTLIARMREPAPLTIYDASPGAVPVSPVALAGTSARECLPSKSVTDQ
jgi:dolichyl-phosphate-mannose-protein mannosyltransferase